jgi:hypothetical protein
VKGRGRTASADGATEGEQKETHEKSRQKIVEAFERNRSGVAVMGLFA